MIAGANSRSAANEGKTIRYPVRSVIIGTRLSGLALLYVADICSSRSPHMEVPTWKCLHGNAYMEIATWKFGVKVSPRDLLVWGFQRI